MSAASIVVSSRVFPSLTLREDPKDTVLSQTCSALPGGSLYLRILAMHIPTPIGFVVVSSSRTFVGNVSLLPCNLTVTSVWEGFLLISYSFWSQKLFVFSLLSFLLLKHMEKARIRIHILFFPYAPQRPGGKELENLWWTAESFIYCIDVKRFLVGLLNYNYNYI